LLQKKIEVFYWCWSSIVLSLFTLVFFIENFNSGFNGFSPKGFRNFSFIKHGPRHFLNYFVHPFYYSILLRGSGNSKLSPDPMRFKIIVELIICELSSVVWYYVLYCWIHFNFDMCFEDFDFFKGLKFMLQQSNTSHYGIVINQQNEIYFTSRWLCTSGATQMCMN